MIIGTVQMRKIYARDLGGTRLTKRAGVARLAALLGVLLVALLLALPVSDARAVSYSSQELELVRLLNEYRVSLGLQPVMVSDLCSDAAEKHSADMGKYAFRGHTTVQSDFFPVGADARVRMARCGYSYPIAWGETIACGFSMASGVMEAWKASSEHQRVIGAPEYRQVGVGLVNVPGSPYGNYWTLDFGVYVDDTAHWIGSPPSSTTTSSSTTTTTTLVAPTTTTTTSTTPPGPTTTTTTTPVVSFADVPPNHNFHDEILGLASAGIISGCDDGLFHPDYPVTRAQMAKITVLALGRHTSEVDNWADPTFPDVPYAGSVYPFDYIEEVAGLGIMQGYDDGTFRPARNLTRLQLALILVRAGGSGLSTPPSWYLCPFTDVPAYAVESVRIATYNGLFSGKTDTLFDPLGWATRGHAAKTVWELLRILGQ